MNFGNLNRIIFLLFVMANCISCITFGPPPYEISTDRDYSFPITGEVLETNNVTSVIEQRLLPWGKKPLPEANVLLLGQIKKPSLQQAPTEFLLPLTKLKYQDDDTIYFLPKYLQPYLWKGTITIDGYSMNNDIEFDVYAGESGSGKQFILIKAVLGQTRLEYDDPFDVYDTYGDFPFLIGYAYLPNNKYRVYAVLDNSPNRSPFYKEVFFNPLQKFQFLDERNAVIAELENDRYTIYDTISETGTGALKQAIALLVAYRHATSVLKDIREGWDMPLFQRYVYK